jgi:hypothetical protein
MELTEELSIGSFSRVSGLTVKALRHYDEIGLLEPARVDEWTGYRYYRLEQGRSSRSSRPDRGQTPLQEGVGSVTEPSRQGPSQPQTT